MDDVSSMTKSLSSAGALNGKSKTASSKVLGVTRDGVSILKPTSPATHFTSREIRQAISTVRAAQKVG